MAKCISILERNEHLGLPGADGVMLGRAIWKFPVLLSELQKAFYPKKNIHSLRDVVESLNVTTICKESGDRHSQGCARLGKSFNNKRSKKVADNARED